MKNLILGLDIGIASVGYGVIDEDGRHITSGVRLFSSGSASKNIDRRGFRGTRRLIRRRKYRINKFNEFFKSKTTVEDNTLTETLFLRKKGLTEKLTTEELYSVLRSMLKHRGISYLDDADAGEGKKGSEYGESILKNKKELEEKKYPCLVQIDRFNKYGKYRGDFFIEEDGKEILVRNIFTKSSYKKEIEEILNTNAKYYDFIDEEFIKTYLEIFMYKRDYSQGPGSKNSRTDYGVYRTTKDENGEYETWTNIFAVLIGKCSIYKEELRGSRASLLAEKFNCLNDLNNIKVKGEKLPLAYKQDLFNYIVEEEKNVTANNIILKLKKEFNIEKDDDKSIKGLREDTKGKKLLHTLEVFHKVKEGAKKENINLDVIMKDYDKIMDALTLNTDKESISAELEKLGITDNKTIEFFVMIKNKHSSKINKWHSFSHKALKVVGEELYKRQEEQMTIITEMGLVKTDEEKYKGKLVPFDLVVEEIYNPVARKSIREALKITNELRKKYGEFKDIVIEMARDDNDEEERKNKASFNKANVKLKEDSIKEFNSELGREIKDTDFYNHKKLGLKIMLWYKQQGVCLYSGEKINVHKLVTDQGYYEIDHIIPESISFDDSQSNKVLVLSVENARKGKKTPYQYLNNNGRTWDYNKFYNFVTSKESKNRLTKRAIRNLTFEEDITKQEVLQGFYARNINDTRYASKVVLNTLQTYFKVNETGTKIKVVNGSFTNQFRKRLRLDKDRDESYAHHGIDALICCYSQVGLNKYTMFSREIVNFETGEIKDEKRFDMLTDDEYEEIMYLANTLSDVKEQLIKAEEKMKFSYKIDTKANRGLVEQTIYGTRELDGKEYIAEKLDIYENFDKFKKIYNKNKESFLMYRNDKKTFEILEKIVNTYGLDENPFEEYKKEWGEFRKYSKKGNGPVIKKMKYCIKDYKVGLDISHKVGNKKGRSFLTGRDTLRLDIYFDNKNKKYVPIRVNLIDCKYVNNNGVVEYVLKEEVYASKFKEQKLNRDDLEFKFHLYKNNFIKIKNDKKIDGLYRLGSFGSDDTGKVLVLKPINKENFNVGRKPTVGTFTTFIKCNVDILGDKHYTSKENFQDTIKYN